MWKKDRETNTARSRRMISTTCARSHRSELGVCPVLEPRPKLCKRSIWRRPGARSLNTVINGLTAYHVRGGHGRGSRAESQELATSVYPTDLRRARTSCLRMRRFCLFPLLSLFADNSMTFATVCLSVCLSLSQSFSLSPFLCLSVCCRGF